MMQPITSKLRCPSLTKLAQWGVLGEAKIIVKLGGYSEMRRQMGSKFDAIVGKPGTRPG